MVSVFVGTVSAFFQTSLRSLWAYSAVSHVGYILLSFSLGSIEGISSGFFYLIIYMLLSVNIFLILLCIKKGNNDRDIRDINELSLFYYSNPILILLLVFCIFALSGLPPFGGFLSKYYLLSSFCING